MSLYFCSIYLGVARAEGHPDPQDLWAGVQLDPIFHQKVIFHGFCGTAKVRLKTTKLHRRTELRNVMIGLYLAQSVTSHTPSSIR